MSDEIKELPKKWISICCDGKKNIVLYFRRVGQKARTIFCAGISNNILCETYNDIIGDLKKCLSLLALCLIGFVKIWDWHYFILPFRTTSGNWHIVFNLQFG